MREFGEGLWKSIEQLDYWLEENDWSAYDPFDGLSSRFLERLAFNNHYLKIAAQQSVRRLPINIRPLVGIRKTKSTKGMGFCALGYVRLYEATKEKKYLEKMRLCLTWLIEHRSRDYTEFAWGNHFSYESRGGTIPLGIPTVVWTSLIANAFLDAYETDGDKTYLRVAESAAQFIVNEIGTFKEDDDSLCFMYTPLTNGNGNSTYEGCIHNSNVLCAWLLARVYTYTKEDKLATLAKQSINYTAKYQRAAGGWYYGEPQKYHWVDSFHTGYVLEAMHGYIKATGDDTYREKLIKGFTYYKETFFKNDGTPWYYDYKKYPIDIQCPSQGIQTLVKLREYNPDALRVAEKVAQWTIDHMQDDEGYFYFRKYPVVTNKTPMLHWGQATMLSALAHLYSVQPE